MSSSNSPSVVQDLQTYYMTGVATFAWVCYDSAIALDQEIEHIWTARWSSAKLLYLLVRYLSFIVLLFYTLMGTIPELPPGVCKAWPAFIGAGIVVIGLSVDIIQILRVRALYNHSRKVTFPMYLLFSATIILAITLTAVVTSTASVTPKPTQVAGCLTDTSNTAATAAWVAQLLLGGSFFTLTLAKLHPYLAGGPVHAPVLTAFVQDGTIFFAVIFVAELFNAIYARVMTSVRPTLQGISPQWLVAVYAIAVEWHQGSFFIYVESSPGLPTPQHSKHVT